MFKKASILLCFVFALMLSKSAFATKWIENFENDLRKGQIEEAVKNALGQDVGKEDIIAALENALEKGIIPEDKADEVGEVLLAQGCPSVCGPSPTRRCGFLAIAIFCCDCCTPLPFWCF
ncbi:MAG: hypothetical protein KJ737_07210 [Proteobacteria bacterium]|nr:hypothetical protein [Pseudomonadota bacterium]